MRKKYHRVGFTAVQSAKLWDRWRRGESLKSIGRELGKPSSCIFNHIRPTGGISPVSRRRSGRALTLAEREEISRGLVAGQSIRRIAAALSRRLEREAGRNVEVMWLTGRLVPDHKTIADFRKDNGTQIRKVCSQFVELCRRIGLLSVASVAIDGSKFKAVNNRDRNFTKAKMARRMQQIEERVGRYLHQLDSADRQEPTAAIASRVDRLCDKIDKLNEEMQRLKALEVQMLGTPDEQISLTDPDARSMATSGRGSGVVGYNVQAAVETDHHLIVAHDVVQTGSDRAQLVPMGRRAKEALGVDELDVVADRGYFSADQMKDCTDADITPTLPKPQTSSNRKKDMFVNQDPLQTCQRRNHNCPQALERVAIILIRVIALALC